MNIATSRFPSSILLHRDTRILFRVDTTVKLTIC
jgi:hypothetical protein